MKTLHLFSHFFLAVTIFMMVAAPAMSQDAVPMLVNYQGELRDASTGDPLEGTHDMLFRIYNDPTDTSPTALVWNESHAAVEVAEGIFSVILGSASPLSAILYRVHHCGRKCPTGGFRRFQYRLRSTAVQFCGGKYPKT